MNDEVCLFEDQMRSVYPKYVHSCPFTPFHQPSASSSCSTSNHHHHPSNHFQHQIHHHNAHVWVLDHSNILMFCRKNFSASEAANSTMFIQIIVQLPLGIVQFINMCVLLRIAIPPQLLTLVCLHVFCPQSGHIWMFASEIHTPHPQRHCQHIIEQLTNY